MYLVNKKLKSMDKEARDVRLQEVKTTQIHPLLHWRAIPVLPLKEVTYRNEDTLSEKALSQTQLAVMHKTYLGSNTIGICEIDSMERFIELEQDYEIFNIYLNFRYDGYGRCNNWARFFQLPKEYNQQNWDCAFFPELAREENGIMIVEVENLYCCVEIYQVKRWLAWPGMYEYPFECFEENYPYFCRCNRLLSVLYEDKLLRSFLENRGVDFDDNFEKWRPDQIRDAASDMRNYCDKLMTGEEMISESNRPLNVLSATQLFEVVEKMQVAIECLGQGSPTIPRQF